MLSSLMRGTVQAARSARSPQSHPVLSRYQRREPCMGSIPSASTLDPNPALCCAGAKTIRVESLLPESDTSRTGQSPARRRGGLLRLGCNHLGHDRAGGICARSGLAGARADHRVPRCQRRARTPPLRVARWRGADSRSDVDLLVRLDEPTTVGRELRRVLGLSEELSQLLKLRVHVATSRTLSPSVRRTALADAIPL
jgi:predicted nucleotidyltransferase